MQHEHHCLPVTALAFLQHKYVLSGEGTFLQAYNLDGTLLKRLQIFERQAIHGIIVSKDDATPTIVVWGGRFITTLHFAFEGDQLSFRQDTVLSANDWILDAAFALREEPFAAVVTAHNALLTLSTEQSSSSSESSHQSHATLVSQISGSNSILYSAHIAWLSPSGCLLACGTAFGEIIVWSTHLPYYDQFLAQRQVHYTFPAHEGSVFGVRLSSSLSLPGFPCDRLLASCSDDRTVRLWDLSLLPDDRGSGTFDGLIRENTGFGSAQCADPNAPPCIAKAMGHISRIWHIRFSLDDAGATLPRILSFGEDAAVITWALNRDGDSFTFDRLQTRRAHAGKNIWSVALDETTQSLATGGADGRIALYPAHGSAQSTTSELLIDSAHDPRCHDSFRTYGFVEANTLVATTNEGRVVTANLADRGVVNQVSAPLPGLRGYSCIATGPSAAFMGGTDGVVYGYVHRSRTVTQLTQIEGKVAALFAGEGRGRPVILATGVAKAVATLILVQNAAKDDLTLTSQRKVDLALTTDFITTCFDYLEDDTHTYALLGSRHGSIAVYVSSSASNTTCTPIAFCPQIHGKEAITAIKLLETTGSTSSNTETHLFSNGRDGTLVVHRLRTSGASIVIELVHQLSLPFGPNIEGLHFSPSNSPLVYGFKGKAFILHDLVEQQDLMTVDCGGAHRTWAFEPDLSGRVGTFIWTKASRVMHAYQTFPGHRILKPGAHGREIKAAAIGPGDLLATGAEDTDIRLFSFGSPGSQATIKCLQVLRRHNTGVQCLRWFGKRLFSSGGFEEFFIWKIRFGVPGLEVGVVCESVHPRSGTSDLRIMGFEVQLDWQNGGIGEEDRFEDEDGDHDIGESDSSFLISMAYSDSTLKLWRYRPSRHSLDANVQARWTLLAKSDYLTHCLTHALLLDYSTLITASTDGHLARWNLAAEGTNQEQEQTYLAWLDRKCVHHNAIHDVHAVDVDDIESEVSAGRRSSSLIFTAGDDNAIAITRTDCSEGGGRWSTLLIPQAHAAAVTALAVHAVSRIGTSDSPKRWILVSAGLDQRIKLWRVEIELQQNGVKGMKVGLIAEVHTGLADVSSVLLSDIEGGDGVRRACMVLVFGVGMGCWNMTLH